MLPVITCYSICPRLIFLCFIELFSVATLKQQTLQHPVAAAVWFRHLFFYSPEFSLFGINGSSCTLHRLPVCSRPPVLSVCLVHVRGGVYNLIGLLARYLLPCSSFPKRPRTSTILMTTTVLHRPCFIYQNRPIMYLCYSQERAAEKQPSIEPCLISSHNEGVNQRAERISSLF